MTLAKKIFAHWGEAQAQQAQQELQNQAQTSGRISGGANEQRRPPTKKELLEKELASEREHEKLKDELTQAIRAIAPTYIALTNQLQGLIAKWNAAQGFWNSDNVGEKIALMHSELSEALEADRKDLPSDKIAYTGVEEELADVEIRRLDFAGHFDLNLGAATITKLLYNLDRPFMHGKSY